MEIRRSELVRLTFGKGTANTAFRWLPFFLPTLTLAFDSSTATLALLLGIAEAAGLCTLVIGRWLDAGRERAVMVVGLFGVVVSSALALVGSVPFFAAGAILLGAASALIAVAGHTWISARVGFDRRARFIGVFEVSWASALLVGVPIIAVLINVFGWRAPFVAVAIAAAFAALLVGTIDDGAEAAARPRSREPKTRFSTDAWLVIGASSAIAMAGLTTIVVAGTWLDEGLGVSTGGVGLVAMAFGVAELLASTSSSAFADRIGKGRSMVFSIAGVLIGLGIIATAASSLLVGATGLFVFFVAFEYSIVTSFSLVSEVMPATRGRVLGIGNAVSTLSRGIGVAAAGVLYDRFGISGPVLLSAAAAATALALLSVVVRRRRDLL